MNFNKHSTLENAHAFLSPSKHHWINYDKEKLVAVYQNHLASLRGTRIHAFAAECISLFQKLPRNQKTLNSFVNDAIGFRMTPEQPLYYSPNCFGTADAISFDGSLLRIHDLKTGFSQASFNQLLVYAALFCLEYKVDPHSISVDLRIYQNDEVKSYDPASDEIAAVMQTIISFDKIITGIKNKND